MVEQFEQFYRCYDRAVDWLDTHRELFNPLTYESDEPSSSIYLTKALGELGLLCMLTARYNQETRNPRIERFLQLLTDIWQQPVFQERLVRRPEYFQLYTMIYVVLRQCNIIDESRRELIQRVIDQGYVLAAETTPMRMLDRRHMLDTGQFQHTLPSYEELYHTTLLAHTPQLADLTDTDVYAITHTLFYLTDFGRTSSPILQGEHLANVQWIIETLLGLYLRHQNWDLVGELLLDCYCLHWYPAPIFDLATSAIQSVQTAQGAIPGPRYSAEQSDTLDERARLHYCFEENYHTTIVNALTNFLIYQDLKASCSTKQKE